LECCLSGGRWTSETVRELAAAQCSDALFRVVAEGLADRFEPVLCDTYARLFAEALAPGESAALVERYQRVRVPRRVEGDPRHVFVLSRVTLGADVAVTSVLLDAAKRRFSDAQIHLVGPRKNWELFAADPRILHRPVNYRRGTLRERLNVVPELRAAVDEPDSITIDPDSRLTQLGLLPICPEQGYYFFESRGYGGAGDDPLPVLARRWAEHTFGIPDAGPYFAAVAEDRARAGGIAVSLGTGENPGKRIAGPFETELMRLLDATGLPICIDQGAGGEEAERVQRAVAASGARAETWSGSFAGFASIIAGSRLYVGYDSAGQHVAAACGTPLITVFAGYPCARMLARWRPWGRGSVRVIPVENPQLALDQLRAVWQDCYNSLNVSQGSDR
jgi:ADP-heptose:LPS heptosyltransferase